jgi:energy-coupling factor transport system permease protein
MKHKIQSAGRFSPAFLLKRCDLHPSLRISALVLMVVLLPSLKLNHLLFLGATLVVMLLYFRISRFFVMIRRMRWLFLSIFLIYAYTTPGQYLIGFPLEVAPTSEGLHAGLLQVSRIALVIAGVVVLMATSTREVLMVGIYSIIKPLSLIGISPERFTARLYLTLQYIETSEFKSKNEKSAWQQMLKLNFYSHEKVLTDEMIRLDLQKIGLFDAICIAGLVLLIGVYW